MTIQIAIIVGSVMISMHLLWVGVALVNIAKEIHKSRESEKGTNAFGVDEDTIKGWNMRAIRDKRR